MEPYHTYRSINIKRVPYGGAAVFGLNGSIHGACALEVYCLLVALYLFYRIFVVSSNGHVSRRRNELAKARGRSSAATASVRSYRSDLGACVADLRGHGVGVHPTPGEVVTRSHGVIPRRGASASSFRAFLLVYPTGVANRWSMPAVGNPGVCADRDWQAAREITATSNTP
ncbi:unnamed protein product, partial [Iphiclides podalirius]